MEVIDSAISIKSSGKQHCCSASVSLFRSVLGLSACQHHQRVPVLSDTIPSDRGGGLECVVAANTVLYELSSTSLPNSLSSLALNVRQVR